MVTFSTCFFGFPFVLINVVVVLATDFTIRKCCPKGYRLLSAVNVRCTTLPAQISANVTAPSNTAESEYDWIPRPFEGEEALDTAHLKVAYGLDPSCGDFQRFRATLYFNSVDYEFKLFANNGSLVEVKKFGEDTYRMGYFSSKSFCVDSVRDPEFTHAAKICFCVEKTCILKCCGHGKYLNTEKNICLPKKKTLPNYLPVIYDQDLIPLTNTPSNMYFMSALPQCIPRGFDVLNGVDQTATSAFFVQSNGNVVLIDDKSNRTVNAMGYCVDIIQTDEETVGPNLAVCQQTKEAVKKGTYTTRRKIQAQTVVKNQSSSSMMSMLSYLHLLPTLSVLTLFQRSII